MNSHFREILSVQGKFVGRGINHEGQAFTGIFEAHPAADQRGLSFSFQAIGDDETIYHSESSLIGIGMSGQLGLWVLSSNHPGVFERTLRSQEELPEGKFSLTFGFGDKSNQESFREEIRLEISPSRSVRYVYFWGMPKGDFAERSGALMHIIR